MKEKNQNFFFELSLEGDHSIKYAFWADARSRAACEYFGDVVSFDTTYNTNRYNLVFCSFVSVNHHTPLHGRKGTKRHSRRPMRIDAKGHRDVHANNSPQLPKSIREAIRQLPSKQRAKRERINTTNFYTVIPCTTKSAIEAQFQHVYTHEKLRKVQGQFRGKVKCITRSTHSTLGFTTYEVVEQVSNSTFNKFFVTYDAVSREVKCRCLLFESSGILCRHSLSVLSFERVDNVALKYILERWSKNIKRRHTHIKSSQDEPLLEPRSNRFDDLVFRSHNICEFASESEELNRILHRAFDNVMAEMQEYQERSKEKSLLSHEEATLSNVNDLQSPPCVRTRGRPKNRFGSNLEKKISNATKRKEKASSKRGKIDLLSIRQIFICAFC
ncbi:hypothetical protein Ahy_A04g018146 [Arachis hypogaea]|uniref:Protein FAR1-RELATED SEQUENCE n=1 Tax=Arachis hypogaea TaxID=3818 RepID=A0A445DCZ0_ARAHY|nr:hypothetical protein Ahy_A04g018146 [Arachis hypogaea]